MSISNLREEILVKTRAALITAPHEDWLVGEVEIEAPGTREVVVELKSCGMCHSDEHVRSGDVLPGHLPMIGGHEGAGVVVEIGPEVTSVEVGDHVAFSFVPACGRCRWCAQGMSYICEEGAKTMMLGMMGDGRVAHTWRGEPVARYAQVGAFSEHQLLAENSVVKVDRDLPWHAVALVSCGVATGYGAAVDRAGTVPGDVVVVVGVGGIGVAAVQGARLAGASRIIAIDPIAQRREDSIPYGATDTFGSMADALEPLREMTRGVLADRVILTPSVMHGDLLQPALALTRKAGTCCVTGVAPMAQKSADIDLFMFAMMNKTLVGTIYGSSNPRQRIPFLLDLYRRGQLKIDEMVTKSYSLDEINQGYADQHEGTITRGVITF